MQFVNAAAERLAQCSAADILGRRIDQVLKVSRDGRAGNLATVLRDALSSSARPGGVGESFLVTTRDGVQREVRCTLMPVRSHAGALLGVVAVFRDAGHARRSERERARLVETARRGEAIAIASQRSLELAERKFAAFMARLPFPAYIVDENGHTLFVNDAGRTAAGWAEALADGRTSETGECTIDVPGEGRRYVDVRFPIRAGERNWLGGLAFDVTDTVRAERALRERNDEVDALLRHVPLATWITRGDDVRCNAAARALPASVREDAVRQCLRAGRPLKEIECETVLEDGTVRAMRITAVPLAAADGAVRGAVALAVDATPIAEYEAVLSRVSAPLR